MTSLSSTELGYGDVPSITTIYSIKCYSCNGTGKLSKEELLDKFIRGYVWCQCNTSEMGNTESDPYHVGDGRDVFGNDTYLCGKCHMVVQFG
jgi:hypothetical protein